MLSQILRRKHQQNVMKNRLFTPEGTSEDITEDSGQGGICPGSGKLLRLGELLYEGWRFPALSSCGAELEFLIDF